MPRLMLRDTKANHLISYYCLCACQTPHSPLFLSVEGTQRKGEEWREGGRWKRAMSKAKNFRRGRLRWRRRGRTSGCMSARSLRTNDRTSPAGRPAEKESLLLCTVELAVYGRPSESEPVRGNGSLPLYYLTIRLLPSHYSVPKGRKKNNFLLICSLPSYPGGFEFVSFLFSFLPSSGFVVSFPLPQL